MFYWLEVSHRTFPFTKREGMNTREWRSRVCQPQTVSLFTVSRKWTPGTPDVSISVNIPCPFTSLEIYICICIWLKCPPLLHLSSNSSPVSFTLEKCNQTLVCNTLFSGHIAMAVLLAGLSLYNIVDYRTEHRYHTISTVLFCHFFEIRKYVFLSLSPVLTTSMWLIKLENVWNVSSLMGSSHGSKMKGLRPFCTHAP